VKQQNRAALLLLVCGFVLSLVLLSLPLCSFSANVYTKKSPNTFRGDEKYQAVLAEVNAVAEEYRAKGFDVEIEESETLRTNSKGETTSLMAFTLHETFGKSLWQFPGSPLVPSYLALALIACFILSALCALAGTLPSMDAPHRTLDARSVSLRGASCWFALCAMLLTPVLVMANNVTFSRRVGLYANELATEGKDAFYAAMDRFLFGGAAGENLDAALKGLQYDASGMLWLLLPAALLMLLAAVQLRFGAIRGPILRGILYFSAVALCLAVLYPYYVMLITAFRSNAETTDMYFLHLFPTKWVWSNLGDIIRRGVPRYLLNSLLVAGGATGIAMLCGIPAAYALARMDFKGKSAFLGFVIMSQMFSPVVLLIGIAQMMSTLHLGDSVVGLMLINAAFNQAFAIWLLRGTFVSISSEMEQAALIDGCNTVQSLIRVLIPMAAPGIVTALIFVFINSWNEYTIATVLIQTAANKPITVGITQFSSFNMIEWQYLFAASLLATIPVVILFMFIEKYLVSGLTSGGVKG